MTAPPPPPRAAPPRSGPPRWRELALAAGLAAACAALIRIFFFTH